MAAVFLLSSVTVVSAATEEEIVESIEYGLEWLANNQDDDGNWPAYWEDTATTGLAVLKFCDYANEQGLNPLDPAYEYSTNVTAGLNHLFTKLLDEDISLQDHTGGATGTVDNPDTNGNGEGIYAHGHGYPFDVYDTGIVLSAISACGNPDRVIVSQNLVVNGMTHKDVAQDMVDWLAFAQADANKIGTQCGEGGWSYGALDNTGQGTHSFGPDNSNSGYAVLGLAYAQDAGLTVPDWVKTELNAYIMCIQDPNDGGSWYDHVGDGIGENILKTGNLIFEMAFVGDTPETQRVQDALSYLENHWADASGANSPPGWNGNPAQYQTMFTTMKGLEFMGIDTFGDPEIDWYEDFSDAIVEQQIKIAGPTNGSWQTSSGRGNPTIITTWALLTLEKVSPPPQVISVFVDIKPSSCPNPINTKSKGVLPVAVLGTEDFDVTTIDPASIRIKLNPDDVGVAPIRWNYEDVATPFEGELCDCHDLNGDGLMDLTLKFDTQEVVRLTLTDEMGNTLPLTITGNLMEEFSGTEIEGQDCVRVLEDKKQNKNGK
ncbi:MAG: hypothetical protein KAS90_03510 [Candidatus Aenigmarchaeota archaeon]|nr:hypothetical protein [Candidatus Aenigmarchaeota archaeon]